MLLGSGYQHATADELILNNGDHISGKIISLSRESLRLSSPHFGILETSRTHIRQFKTETSMVVELLSAERMIGAIESSSNTNIIVHSATLGGIELPFSKVAAIYLPEEIPAHQSGKSDASVTAATADSTPCSFSDAQKLHPEQLQKIRGAGRGNPPPVQGTTAEQHKPIGTKPEIEEDIRQIFLRQTSVLLRPGEKEIEVGFDYLLNQFNAAIYNSKYRQFQIPLAFRIGLLDGLESSLSIPLIHAEQETSFAGEQVEQETTGVGDMLLGLNYEIFRETARWPDITTLFRVRIPTGEEPEEDGLTTGSGHWAGTLGFQFTKTTDPIVLFWGAGYTHELPATYYFNDGVYKVQPGDTLDYNFGFGFAVNEKVSLSTQIMGAHQWDTELDGEKLSGSSTDPLSLRSALTYRISGESFIEPSLKMGLNDDTADFVLGIAATRRFGR